MIVALSAVTLTVSDMARSVRFYLSLGFVIRYGGEDAAFTSFTIAGSYLNLDLKRDYAGAAGWGRVIFYVDNVDAVYERALGLGYQPRTRPRDAEWGERYFHLGDPDGHELSFARLLNR
jgi:catechol 2,3-dioxygenase-like lactoylglutathione lyase family enzyme